MTEKLIPGLDRGDPVLPGAEQPLSARPPGNDDDDDDYDALSLIQPIWPGLVVAGAGTVGFDVATGLVLAGAGGATIPTSLLVAKALAIKKAALISAILASRDDNWDGGEVRFIVLTLANVPVLPKE